MMRSTDIERAEFRHIVKGVAWGLVFSACIWIAVSLLCRGKL